MTMLPRLASLIFNRVHWIEPGAADVILGVLDGRIGDLRMSRFEGEQVFSREGRWRGYSTTGRGTAIVPIVGELVNRGAYLGANSGLVSYEGVRQQLKNAAGDPAVRAIVLDIDSPGGMVSGCAETAALVRQISHTKPVVACANADTCSAAYAIASGSNMIVASESSRTGSIGVVFVHANHERALDKKGIDVTIFQGGKHKVDGHPFGPLSPEVAADIQANIAAHYDAFVKLVVAGRPQLSEQNVRDTEARVYRGQDAVSLGVADRVGTFEEAVALAEGGQVRTRPQERSSVPASTNPPQKVAAKSGASRMDVNQEAAPVSGYEQMTVAQVELAVQSLRTSLGFDAGLQAAQQSAAPEAVASALAQAAASVPSETIEQAVARGRAAEKGRVKAILALPEAKERPLAALALAVETDVPAASAGAVLGKIPAEAQAGTRGSAFYGAIAAAGGTPKVSHMTAPEETPKASSLVSGAKALAAKTARPTRMQIPTRGNV